jgi:hypothetical protein
MLDVGCWVFDVGVLDVDWFSAEFECEVRKKSERLCPIIR